MAGINHLALVTNDMDAMVRFTTHARARLVATIGTPDFRHYFFEFAHRTRLPFEYADSPTEPFASRRYP